MFYYAPALGAKVNHTRKERAMPTDTAVQRPPTRAQLVPGMLPAGSYSLEQLEHLATVCHKSGLFDDVTDAAQAFMKILKGQELGLPVTASMQGFDIIRKKLFIKPATIGALINTCGYGSYRVVEQTDQVCTIHFLRKYPGQGWLDCPPVSYTLAEAKAHGLVERSPHWKASPAHMLFQRCMGRGGAMYFPELLAGLQPPQDDTAIAPEQHAQNLCDVYGVEPESIATATPAADQEAALSSDAGGHAGSIYVTQVEALHRAYGKDEAWMAGWWAKVCKERAVSDRTHLPVSVLSDLLTRMRRYYQQGEASPLAADERAAAEAPAQEGEAQQEAGDA